MPSLRLASAALCAGLAALVSQSAGAVCYVVYNADDQVIYRAQTPPVDMSLHLHESLPRVAPGGKLVFTLSNHGCELEIDHITGNNNAASQQSNLFVEAARQQEAMERDKP